MPNQNWMHSRSMPNEDAEKIRVHESFEHLRNLEKNYKDHPLYSIEDLPDLLKEQEEDERREKREALTWISMRSTSEGDFKYACRILGIDPKLDHEETINEKHERRQKT